MEQEIKDLIKRYEIKKEQAETEELKNQEWIGRKIYFQTIVKECQEFIIQLEIMLERLKREVIK